MHATTDSFSETVEKARLYVEANEMTVATDIAKKPAVHFAGVEDIPNEETRTDKILDGLERVLQAVLKNQGSPGSQGLNQGCPATQNRSHNDSVDSGGSKTDAWNRHFSPARSNNCSDYTNRRANFAGGGVQNTPNQNRGWNPANDNNRGNTNAPQELLHTARERVSKFSTPCQPLLQTMVMQITDHQ